VLAGRQAAAEAFRQVSELVTCHWHAGDGGSLVAGRSIASVEGPMAAVLTAERTALNFLGHLSGIATLTRRYVDRARPVTIRDTRKTTPGLRALEKAAVRAGGGVNHRAGLYDAILIKENHVALAGGVGEAVQRARAAGRDPAQGQPPGGPVHR